MLDETLLGFALQDDVPGEAWLIEADATGKPLRFVDHVSFAAAVEGESFGRWPNGTGALSPQTSVTVGTTNSGPRTGPLVVTEIHYHPADPGSGIDEDMLELVELFNPTLITVDLSGWTIQGIDVVIPATTTLGPGQLLVVVPFDPALDPQSVADFETTFGVNISTSTAKFVGGFPGLLDDDGEFLTVFSANALPTGQLVVEDHIQYADNAPWPSNADGTGQSINRVGSQFWGGDSTSWYAFAPSPGRTIPLIFGDLNQDFILNPADIDLLYANLESDDDVFDLDADQDADRDDVVELVTTIMQRRFGDADLDGDVDITDFNSLAANFNPLGSSGQVGWALGNFDGDNDVDITDFSMITRNFAPLGYLTGIQASNIATATVSTRVEPFGNALDQQEPSALPWQSIRTAQKLADSTVDIASVTNPANRDVALHQEAASPDGASQPLFSHDSLSNETTVARKRIEAVFRDVGLAGSLE